MTFLASPVPGPLHAVPSSASFAAQAIMVRRAQHRDAVRNVALTRDLAKALILYAEATACVDRDALPFTWLACDPGRSRCDASRHRMSKLTPRGGGRHG